MTDRVADPIEAFRRLYFHLYSNGPATRAERIIENLSLLLLTSLSAEVAGRSGLIDDFLRGRATSAQLLALAHDCYPRLIGSHQSFTLDDDVLRPALRELRGVSLTSSPAHMLGDVFQAVLGPRLRGDKGQFFTPRSLVRCMIAVLDPAPAETVVDPACGTGGFLYETYAYWQRTGLLPPPPGALVGVDKDHDLHRLSCALLAISCGHAALTANANSLDLATWTEPLPALGTADVVLTNPPFGAKIGVTDPALLSLYALGHQWAHDPDTGRHSQTSSAAPAQDPQVLFLELCVRLLKPGGRLGIVLPEGLFGNRRSRYIWDWLQAEGSIMSLLDCPRTTFQPGTDTKTNVLFFRKHLTDSPPRSSREVVRIGVAIDCGHDKRGRSTKVNGEPHPDDFTTLGAAYGSPSSPLWSTVALTGQDYRVPRYFAQPAQLSDHEAAVIGATEWISIETALAKGWISIRKGHEVGSEEYGTGDVPFIRTSDLANLEISADPTKSVREEVYQQYARHQDLTPGTVLMVADGRYRIGATAMLTKNNARCVVQSHLRIISVDASAPFDSYALLYALNLPSVRQNMRNLIFVQSTLGTLGPRIREIRIPLLFSGGPWEDRLDQFRTALAERDRLAAEIRRMTSPGYEV